MPELLSVITLPVLAPLAALLQLLFPGLLRDQWKQYRAAVVVLMTQSTLLFAHWAAVRWLVSERAWWTSELALGLGMAGVALVGLVASACAARRFAAYTGQSPGRPTRVEQIALWVFLFLGLGWALYQYLADGAVLDQMAIVTAACAAGIVHLFYRRTRSAGAARPRVTTELVFLSTILLAGLALAIFPGDVANRHAGPIRGQWLTYRGNEHRTGTVIGVASAAASQSRVAPGPAPPELLWTFDPGRRRGRVKIHSTPAVVDGLVFVGALYELQTFSQGFLFCVNAQDGRVLADGPARPGEMLWRFAGGDTVKPVFSSPAVSGGNIYFGEGYHQDKRCRLFCLDGGFGQRVLWERATASHVESSPTIVGDQIFVGAGDDGLLCLSARETSSDAAGRAVPKTLWQVEGIHVDASPLVVAGRVYVGTCVG
ncbi:MAG: PQQ-like beta-propeller repeat protein, partial [Planctomycetia bacterium]|nr:PQQ-like beta-propeller repeat protein [Planctomycetia bacterium]